MDSAAIFTAVAGTGILGLIVIAALRLVGSASAADQHLNTATGAGSAAPASRAANLRAFADGASTTADASPQAIFEQLQQYYAANIKQGSTIFWASLMTMCIGFAIVLAGIALARTNAVSAIVAAVAGVLSQFIAATFLVVLRSTQQQATTYAQTLVELHLRDVGRATDDRSQLLGLRLLGEISADRSDPANPAKAAIAMGLIVKTAPPAAPFEPPAVTVEVPPPGRDPALDRPRTTSITFDDTGTVERR